MVKLYYNDMVKHLVMVMLQTMEESGEEIVSVLIFIIICVKCCREPRLHFYANIYPIVELVRVG